MKSFKVGIIHGGSLDWIALDCKGSTKSIPVWTIVLRVDTFSAQVLEALTRAQTSIFWGYMRMARRLLGLKSLDLTVNRGCGSSD